MNDQAFDHWHEHGMEAIGYINDRLAEIEEKQLSFRDQCAITAMESAVVAVADQETIVSAAKVLGIPAATYDPALHWPKLVAFHAFDLADAMEVERLKRITDKRIAAEEAMREATK